MYYAFYVKRVKNIHTEYNIYPKKLTNYIECKLFGGILSSMQIKTR